MVAFDRNLLCLFDLVDALQNRQTVADTGNSHLLQIVVLQGDKSLANNVIF